MKTKVAIILSLVLFAFAAFGQSSMTVSVLTGYTMTAFEDQESAAGTLPIGVQVGYKVNPVIEVGAEFNMALGGFTFESEEYGVTETLTFNQTIIGAFGKYTLGSSNIQPFGKVGIGMYSGNSKVEWKGGVGSEGEGSAEVDIDSAIGFSVGVGVTMTKSLFAEFNYHIVTREKMGMNTWAVLLGYKIIK